MFFPIYFSLKTTHWWFFHVLKSEDNTWMFFSIYLNLKTTHRCFFLPFTSAWRQHINVCFPFI
jgi:hypothetical protein